MEAGGEGVSRALILDFYERADGKWAWRAKARNGQIVATDGGQGYENKGDAMDAATLVTGLGLRSDITFALTVNGEIV